MFFPPLFSELTPIRVLHSSFSVPSMNVAEAQKKLGVPFFNSDSRLRAARLTPLGSLPPSTLRCRLTPLGAPPLSRQGHAAPSAAHGTDVSRDTTIGSKATCSKRTASSSRCSSNNLSFWLLHKTCFLSTHQK